MSIKHIPLILLTFSFSLLNAQNDKFLMHSHNDYEQEIPLSTALKNDFNSIEVDVFEYNDNIVVSHDDDNLDQKATLKDMYLDPLSKFAFKQNQSIYLLIDLKMEGTKILDVLHKLIESYSETFKNRNDLSRHAPLQIILSGSVDKDYVFSNDSLYYFFIDGRIEDLKYNNNSELMPLISADIEDLYCWKPSKKVVKSKLRPIQTAIENVHGQGKLIRFWNTAEATELWDLLVALDVDIIGVDNIEKLKVYSSKFSKLRNLTYHPNASRILL